MRTTRTRTTRTTEDEDNEEEDNEEEDRGIRGCVWVGRGGSGTFICAASCAATQSGTPFWITHLQAATTSCPSSSLLHKKLPYKG